MHTRTIPLFALLALPMLGLFAQPTVGGGGSSATAFCLAADVCGDELTSQYVLLRVGAASHDFSAQPPVLRSRCSAGPLNGSVTAFSANATAVQQLNQKVGNCFPAIFQDLMAPPFKGQAPPLARVMLFVSASPDVAAIPAGALAGLCGSGPVFVAFGDFAGVRPFLPNNQPLNSACGNVVTVTSTIGAATQTIKYEPQKLAPSDGASVRVEPSGVVWYDQATNCAIPALACANPISVSFSGDLELCQGESTVITASATGGGNTGTGVGSGMGGYEYQWITGDKKPAIGVQPAITSDYFVTVTSADFPACRTAAKTTVRVFVPPVPVVGMIPETPCRGQSVTLNYHFGKLSAPPHDHRWISPSGQIVQNDVVAPLVSSKAGPYKLLVEFSNGCTVERDLEVNFSTLPIKICDELRCHYYAAFRYGCDTLKGGCPDSLLLEASAPGAVSFVWTGPGGYWVLVDSINWEWDWVEEPWTATGSSQIKEFPCPGTYTVTVTDENGCTHEKSIQIDEVCNSWMCGNQGEIKGPKSPPTVLPPSQGQNAPPQSFAAPQKEQKKALFGIAVFPNPASGVFQIALPAEVGLFQIDVFDALARPFLSQKARENASIEAGGWPSGLYFIRARPLEKEAEAIWKSVVIEAR